MSKQWQEVTQTSSWNFDENPDLVGVLVSKESGVGKNNSHFYKFETEGGEIVGVWGSTVLDDRLAAVETGTEVKISYLGMIKNEATGRQYKSFKVFV